MAESHTLYFCVCEGLKSCASKAAYSILVFFAVGVKGMESNLETCFWTTTNFSLGAATMEETIAQIRDQPVSRFDPIPSNIGLLNIICWKHFIKFQKVAWRCRDIFQQFYSPWNVLWNMWTSNETPSISAVYLIGLKFGLCPSLTQICPHNKFQSNWISSLKDMAF